MGLSNRDEIIAAAEAVFIRYGFKRVTMGDIAREAGMSRPALYLTFCNKEEVFKAVIGRFAERALAEMADVLHAHTTIPDKLRVAFNIWTLRPYAMMQSSPDAKELVECSHSFAREVIEEGYGRFESVLESILEPAAAHLMGVGLAPQQVARVASRAARGFKETASSEAQLRGLVDDLIKMLGAIAQPTQLEHGRRIPVIDRAEVE